MQHPNTHFYVLTAYLHAFAFAPKENTNVLFFLSAVPTSIIPFIEIRVTCRLRSPAP